MKCQLACKPGSVWPDLRPARQPFILDGCCHPPPATYPDDWPETDRQAFAWHAVPIRFCSRWGLPCRSCYQQRGGLLPHPFTLTPSFLAPNRQWSGATKDGAVSFLWHFPWGRPRRTLSGTVFPWSPDFPHVPPFGFWHARLPGQL